MDQEEAEVYPLAIQGSSGSQDLWWDRGPACAHPVLNSTRFSCRAALVASGEGQGLWPSNLRDVPQIFWVLRDLPALPDHCFGLLFHLHTMMLNESCTNRTPLRCIPTLIPFQGARARRGLLDVPLALPPEERLLRLPGFISQPHTANIQFPKSDRAWLCLPVGT